MLWSSLAAALAFRAFTDFCLAAFARLLIGVDLVPFPIVFPIKLFLDTPHRLLIWFDFDWHRRRQRLLSHLKRFYADSP